MKKTCEEIKKKYAEEIESFAWGVAEALIQWTDVDYENHYLDTFKNYTIIIDSYKELANFCREKATNYIVPILIEVDEAVELFERYKMSSPYCLGTDGVWDIPTEEEIDFHENFNGYCGERFFCGMYDNPIGEFKRRYNIGGCLINNYELKRLFFDDICGKNSKIARLKTREEMNKEYEDSEKRYRQSYNVK